MVYSIDQFFKEFPTDDACLEYIKNKKYPDKTLYRIQGRMCYSDVYGTQYYPLVGTIFEKSRTPLRKWFYALFLFSQSSHGISSAELARQLGVTYKCAWRIGHKIRSLMNTPEGKLSGIIEVDETYVGRKTKKGRRGRGTTKTPVFGMVERGGRIKVMTVPRVDSHTLVMRIKRNVKRRSIIMSDEFRSYNPLKYEEYGHQTVQHGTREYVRGNAHTNTLEGFWSLVKRSLRSTHGSVSKRHLQKYLNERAWHYSNRKNPSHPFHLLLQSLC